jgi:hypothetical protein
MKKRLLFVLLFAFVETGCKDSFPESDVPEWLSIRIRKFKDMATVSVRIYKGEWNGRAVYFIRDTLGSCMFCEVYYGNGDQVLWLPGDDSFDSVDRSDWVLIYEFGEGTVYDNN